MIAFQQFLGHIGLNGSCKAAALHPPGTEMCIRDRPTLVLDIKKYRTIPMAIQYFRGGYGRVELAPMMACIIIAIIPIIILYMTCQKYIIEGVVAGAVKG